MKKLIFTLFCLSVSVLGFAQGPNNSGTYYRNADGKKGEALKTSLYTIISKKNNMSYDALIDAYTKTDVREDGFLRDWYSNVTHYKPGSKTGSYKQEGDTYNREHSVPQSWGAPKADIMHVIPTDGYVNNRRSNYPFGEVGTVKYESTNGYSKLGTCKTAGYSGTVFEPNDEVKGDIARIYFYMATCYEGTCQNWGHDVFTGTKYQPMAQWTYDMMVRWSKLDPVDEVEIARNNAIAASDVQGNRNPFVDYPGLEEYVWGSKKDVAFSYNNYEGAGPGPQVEEVEPPVFSPNGGTFTDQVTVTITTATNGATIYYTTTGAEPSEQSKVYEGPITLTTTTTLKAIAVKDGEKSFQTSATFTIESGGDPSVPVEGTIALNNQFFGVNYSGSISKSDSEDLVGTQDGVTVVYALGEGSNRYCNDQQIRLYQKNTLTISVDQGDLVELEFTVDLNKDGKTLQASTGSVNDYIWTGNAQSVTFSVDDGSGHLRLSSVKVKLAASGGTTAISTAAAASAGKNTFHTLSGVRVDGSRLQPGLYIYNGKKILVK